MASESAIDEKEILSSLKLKEKLLNDLKTNAKDGIEINKVLLEYEITVLIDVP